MLVRFPCRVLPLCLLCTSEVTVSRQWEKVRHKSLQLVLELDWKLDLRPREIAGSLGTHLRFHGLLRTLPHEVMGETLSLVLSRPFHFLESNFHLEICGLGFKIYMGEDRPKWTRAHKNFYSTSYKTRVAGKPESRGRAHDVDKAALESSVSPLYFQKESYSEEQVPPAPDSGEKEKQISALWVWFPASELRADLQGTFCGILAKQDQQRRARSKR